MALLATLPNGERQNNVGKKKDGSVTTWRFDLALEEPTDDKTNEFSYIHLVHDAMKKVMAYVMNNNVTIAVGVEFWVMSIFRLLGSPPFCGSRICVGGRRKVGICVSITFFLQRDTPPVEDDGPVDSKLLRIAKELEEKYVSRRLV